MTKWIYFGLASLGGCFARYFVSGIVNQMFGVSFPYGTLVVNLAGCFLTGFLATISDERLLLSPQMKTMLLVGFCGAFTTFSTFMFETDNLIKAGETLRALLNVLISVLIGFLVFRIGILVGKLMF